jgi:hypothetical protein
VKHEKCKIMNPSGTPTSSQELAAIDRRLGEIQAEIAAIPRPLYPGDPGQIRFSSLRGEEKRLAAKMISIVTEAP